MNIKSLTLKNILSDENGENYFDLSVPSFDISNISISDVHLVTQDEEGRIDKICQKYYGCTDYIDVLCFINHIFNPFSVKENELVVIPNITANISEIYGKPDVPTWISNTEKQTGSSKKTNEKDENRVNRIKQKNSPRKPNELIEGQSVKKYVNGKVILGTHLNTNNGR